MLGSGCMGVSMYGAQVLPIFLRQWSCCFIPFVITSCDLTVSHCLNPKSRFHHLSQKVGIWINVIFFERPIFILIIIYISICLNRCARHLGGFICFLGFFVFLSFFFFFLIWLGLFRLLFLQFDFPFLHFNFGYFGAIFLILFFQRTRILIAGTILTRGPVKRAGN